MPHASWKDAVAKIRALTAPATASQRRLASVGGGELPDDLPQLVAAARLLALFRFELGLAVPTPCLDVQRELIAELETENVRAEPEPADRREADAWIYYLRLQRRQRALESLELEAGDIVLAEDTSGPQVAEVSSIGGEGRIYFKGGCGAGAWPDVVTVQCRRSDRSDAASDVRRTAANQASSRARTSRWSEAKQYELEWFAVRLELTRRDVEELEEVVETASDEKPIQKFIESRPQVLTSLLGGQVRFCLPHPRLGGDRIPDFFVADVDSLGVRWVMVEIETPRSDMTLQDDAILEKHARKGVSQVGIRCTTPVSRRRREG